MKDALLLFTSTASQGQANSADATTSLLINIGLIALLVGAMYFIMIRPQRKKQKEEQLMRDNLAIGDEIVTIGGIVGRVVSMKDDSILIETGADRDKLRVMKWAIQSVNKADSE